MTKRTRGRSIDIDIQEIIEDKAREGRGPTQILRHLESFLTNEGKNRYPPDIRTIQRIVKDLVIRDTGEIWSIDNSGEEDARIVLDVLASRLALGITKFFTKTEADWIIKVRKAALDAPNNIVFILAFSYAVKEDAGYDPRAMDGYLAFSPWRDKDSFRRYKRAVARKTIPRVPAWSILVDDLEELFESILPDTRFDRDAVAINKFEKDIYELSVKGESLDVVADLYNVHPDDISDIIQKYEKGDAK